MTIATIDSVVAGMMLMTELNRLRLKIILAREIIRMSQSHHGGESQTNHENSGEQTKTRNKIRAAVKNLGHFSVAL
jgi:hypothetical protein